MRTTIRKLVDTFKALRENPALVITTGVWNDPEWNGATFRAWFLACLQEKINARDPRTVKGRKTSQEYTTELGRLRRYVGNRIVIDWIAPILGARVKLALHSRLREQLQ